MTRDEFTAHLELHGARLYKDSDFHFYIRRGERLIRSSVFDNGPWDPLSLGAQKFLITPAEWSEIGDEMLHGSLEVLHTLFQPTTD